MHNLRRFFIVVATFTLVTSAAQVAHARGRGEDKAKLAESLKYFQQGTNMYRVGDFAGAVTALRKAYEIRPEPLLLYNLGRALEGAHDLAAAVHTYRQYLSTATDIEDRDALETRVADLEKQVEEKRLLDQEAQRKRVLPVEPPPPPPSAAPARQGASVLPWIVAGAGGAVLATGGVFGMLANKKHNDAVSAPNQAEAQQLQQDAKGMATLSNVLFVTGGVVAASGIVWALVGGGGSSSPERGPSDAVSVTPVVGPAWVGVQGHF